MRTQNLIALGAAALAVSLGALPAAADSVSVFVTPYAQQSLKGCGPAVAQMAMESYPSGAGCSLLQPDIWDEIQDRKVETIWDSDPAGLAAAMQHLCPPIGNWVIHSDTDPAVVMNAAFFWMNALHYPVPVLLDTATYSLDPTHQEHWALIFAMNTSGGVLDSLWLVDPEVWGTTLPLVPVVRFIAAATWAGEYQAVAKPSSAYHGKYVALIEPPDRPGRLRLPERLPLLGRVISPEEALAAAARAIEEHRLAEAEAFRLLRDPRPLTPVLVNREQGGYYLVPYAEEGDLAGAALVINAYTGQLQEAGAFAPSRLLSAGEARAIALEHLGATAPREVAVEAVVRGPLPGAARYAPTWKVRVDGELLGVSQTGEVVPGISDELFSLRIPARRLVGIGGGGGRLWATDVGGRSLIELQPDTGGVLRRLALDLREPRGLAFDGRLLWVADQATKRIRAFGPAAGEPVRDIPLEVPAEKGFSSVEALAWDGQYLWTAIAAGFSSSLNQIDPQSGRIVQSLFADCDPRGLASDGRFLWTLCYNGEANPPTVDQRRLADDEREVSRSRQFFKKTEGRQPSGLTWDGQFLWYVDAGENRAVRFTAPAGEPSER